VAKRRVGDEVGDDVIPSEGAIEPRSSKEERDDHEGLGEGADAHDGWLAGVIEVGRVVVMVLITVVLSWS